MKIFISWSGPSSQKIAGFLREWLPNIIQEASVWVSAQDIEKGQRWLVAVSSSLSESNYGIIVVTPENKRAPWLMFEAGALSKSLDARVTALLCGLQHSDVAGTPLFQFQNTIIGQDEVFAAVRSINSAAETPLNEGRLKTVFDKFWPDLDDFYKTIHFQSEEKIDSEKDIDIVGRMKAVLEEFARSAQKNQYNADVRVAAERNSRHQDRKGRLHPPLDYVAPGSKIVVSRHESLQFEPTSVAKDFRSIIEAAADVGVRENSMIFVLKSPTSLDKLDAAVEYLKIQNWVADVQVEMAE